MKVWMLLLISFSYSALSSEFSHIKLNPDFEQYLTLSHLKSNQTKSFKSKNSSRILDMEEKMFAALLGHTPPLMSGLTSPGPIDGQESPLYQEIRHHLEVSHQTIGQEEVQNINRLNQQFNLGSQNFSGFSWQKPFGVVQVNVDRQVTPNMFGQNWLVMDTFTFEIEATTFLERLTQSGLSGMNATEIGAFAGITFKRIYTYWHYATSYQEGLIADFSKLFLPFLKFNTNSIEKMGNEEIMKREDTWTASAGGLISTPPLYNVSFSAGALAQNDYQNVLTIQSHHQEDKRYKIGVLGKKSAALGVSAELQLDFFKLLKLSLLRYDMNYEYASGKEFTLGLRLPQWESIKGDSALSDELKSILAGTGSIRQLEPYVVRLDESSSSTVEQRGSVLIWGKMQKQKTEQVRVIKDQLVRVFYKNYSQSVKVVQNILSRLFSVIVYKLLKFPVGVNNAAVYSKQVVMEYEATHTQATEPKIIRIDGAEQFSFLLTQYYNASRTDRWIDRKFKNDLIWFVENFTTLPKTYKTDIRNEVIMGPMLIESTLRVDQAGFRYILNRSENEVFQQVAIVCNSERVSDWANEKNRRELLEDITLGKESCVRDIGVKYLEFREDYFTNALKPSIAKFKEFITKYYKVAQSLSDLSNLFGVENTFIHGRLQAKTSRGAGFSTSFSTGQFRGLGVIDNFKRSEGSRVPASIPSE
jgi:hypothetical protein